MRIALFTDGIYPYVLGGMQKHSFYLAKYLARAGVEVDLYHFNSGQLDIAKLELFSDSERKMIRSFVIAFPSRGSLPGHYIRESFDYSCRVYDSFLQNGAVDYIYAKGFSAWKLLDEKRKGKTLPMVGVNFHGYEMFQQTSGLRRIMEQSLLRPPVKFNLTHADHVYSYGGKITDLLQSVGVPISKIRELPTGIDQGWIASSVRKAEVIRKFIFVGRYEHRKGIRELNKVLIGLKEHSFEFVFVGPIPTKRQISRAGVKYAGPVMETNAMQELLSAADILVCPSHAEGMPNVIMEAMARGLAVIATDVGAVSAMVSEANGWLIEVRSETALKQALFAAMEISSEQLEQKKTYSLNLVAERFLWDKLIQRLIGNLKEPAEAKSHAQD
jgi:glycosyltransferase involved in cell wall biosynthesis